MSSFNPDNLQFGDLIVYGEITDTIISKQRMFALVVLVDKEEGLIIRDIIVSSERQYQVPLADFKKMQDYHLLFHNIGQLPSDDLRPESIKENFPEYFI